MLLTTVSVRLPAVRMGRFVGVMSMMAAPAFNPARTCVPCNASINAIVHCTSLCGSMCNRRSGFIARFQFQEFENLPVVGTEFRVGDATGRASGRTVSGLEHVVMVSRIGADLPDANDLD